MSPLRFATALQTVASPPIEIRCKSISYFLLSLLFSRLSFHDNLPLETGSWKVLHIAIDAHSVGAGLAGIASRSAYNASKHGLIGLTHTLAAEWGGYGIRTNAVCPGWVKTEMDHVDQAKKLYSDADIEHRVPMGRFANPNDVAEAILFLADSDRSAFVNGVELRVDGGWLTDFGWESLRLAHR